MRNEWKWRETKFASKKPNLERRKLHRKQSEAGSGRTAICILCLTSANNREWIKNTLHSIILRMGMRAKCGQRQASVCRTTKKSNSLEFTLFDSHMHSAHCTPWIRAPRPFNSVAHANRQILVSNFVFDAFSGSDTTASHSHTQRPVSIFYINFEWICFILRKINIFFFLLRFTCREQSIHV